MKKFQLVLVAVLLVAVSWFAIVKKVKVELPSYGQVPPFEFQDQSGKDFSSQSLKGKVWVAGFIFTRCAGPCPVISSKMAALKKRLHYSTKFNLVSFSIDPEYDTPEKLSEYSKNFDQAEGPQWHFLTGSKANIHELAAKAFMQAASEDASQENIQNRFMHGTRLALVDTAGNIRGFYDSASPTVVDELERDIRSIL